MNSRNLTAEKVSIIFVLVVFSHAQSNRDLRQTIVVNILLFCNHNNKKNITSLLVFLVGNLDPILFG